MTSTLEDALPELLTRAYGRPVQVLQARRSSYGASRHTWSLDVSVDGSAPVGLVLQVERAGNGPGTTDMTTQAALLHAAAAAGVPVAGTVAAGEEGGAAYLLCERVEGETLARRLLREPAYAGARAAFATDCGRALARLHAVDPADLPPLPHVDQLADVVATIDAADEPHPAFELAVRWLAAHRPPDVEPVPVHGDFRLGNLLLGPDGLRAVLDWELAHLGDPAEDLGWLCLKAWRFGAAPEVGGMATREQLLAAYAGAGGRPVDPAAVAWWQVLGTLKWGAICLTQARVHLSGATRSVELAAIGRRVCETEHDLLELIPHERSTRAVPRDEGVGAPPACGASTGVIASLHDRPHLPELLAAVREHLEEHVAPALPEDQLYHLRVAVNLLRTAEREVELGPAQAADHAARLAALGFADDRALATALRAGEVDEAALPDVRAAVAAAVRDKLLVANPRYLT